MSQSKKGSLAEALINTAIGFVINTIANITVLPALGIPVTIADSLHISVVFTFISVARSYVIRRWFNDMIVRASKRITGEA